MMNRVILLTIILALFIGSACALTVQPTTIPVQKRADTPIPAQPNPTLPNPTQPNPTKPKPTQPKSSQTQSSSRDNWQDAEQYVDQVVTICGPVVGTTYASTSDGSPTFLNIGYDYPNPDRFTALIWGNYRENFPSSPESYYLGHNVCVVGKVELYRGVPEIEITGPDSITIED